MNSARVSRNLGSVHAASAVSSARRLPTSGRVRPGIKVLTRSAAAVKGAADTYAQGLAAGASFDEIGAALSKLQGIPKYPLTPKNAPYFTVRQGDFSTPGAVDAIMTAHATVRPGDPSRACTPSRSSSHRMMSTWCSARPSRRGRPLSCCAGPSQTQSLAG